MSRSKADKSGQQCAGRVKPSRYALVWLIGSLGLAGPVHGQAGPRSSRPTRIPSPDTAITAPQHASPDADYALSSTASRTVAPSDTNDTNMEINDMLARRLWQNRISAPDPDEDAEVRSALRSLIQQVQSVTFNDTATEPTYSAPLVSPVEPAGLNIDTGAENTSEPPQPLTVPASTAEPAPSLPTDTLNKLETLMENPDQVTDPLEMAELLFLSGRVVEAAVFYEKALARIPANDLTTREDRAWVLFQLGNCLRDTDISKARDTYMKLIAQHPNSPWTELAKAHGRLITWYQSARPDQLVSQAE